MPSHQAQASVCARTTIATEVLCSLDELESRVRGLTDFIENRLSPIMEECDPPAQEKHVPPIQRTYPELFSNIRSHVDNIHEMVVRIESYIHRCAI